jgi:type II secretory pathway pseudopilin PulG
MSRQDGFSYIGILIFIALMGVALAGVGQFSSQISKREQEQELLFVGNQYRTALELYYRHSSGTDRFPQTLKDLLKDPRYPDTQRYLRRLYPDPITGKTDWGLMKNLNGEIIGVYSRSENEPLKKYGFIRANQNFEGATKYSDWVFMLPPDRFPPVQKQ